jgi:acetyl-CoA carboxylase carboxyl transferase subunit alpha
VIPEPLGGAHNDPAAAAEALKQAVVRHLSELQKISGEERRRQRYAKFRAYGRFTQQPSRLTASVDAVSASPAAAESTAGPQV